MHICYIYPGFPPEDHAGGIGTYIYEFINSLKKSDNNICVTIISRSDKYNSSHKKLKPNIDLYRLGEMPTSRKNKVLLFRYNGFKFYYQRVYELVKKINDIKPIDIIESCDWGAESYNLLSEFNCKLIVRCHTPSFISEFYNPSNSDYLSKEIKQREKELLGRAKNISSPSHSLVKEIKKYIVIKTKIKIEPYPIESSKIALKRSYNINNKIKLQMAGRLEERKGQDILIEAIRLLDDSNIEVHFYGADTLISDLKSFGQKLLLKLPPRLRKNIYFHGVLPRKDLLNKYKDFDIYIAASRFDNFSFTVLEAMAAGLPVIGNNKSGIAEQINNRITGLLFDNTPEELANKILMYKQDLDLRRYCGENAKNYVKKYFNPIIVTNLIVENYKRVMMAYV